MGITTLIPIKCCRDIPAVQPAEYRNSLNLAKKQTRSNLRLNSFSKRVIDNGNNLSNHMVSLNKNTFQTDLTHTGKTPKQVTTVYTWVATFMNHNLNSCSDVPGTLLTHRSSSEHSINAEPLTNWTVQKTTSYGKTTGTHQVQTMTLKGNVYIMTTAQMIQMLE